MNSYFIVAALAAGLAAPARGQASAWQGLSGWAWELGLQDAVPPPDAPQGAPAPAPGLSEKELRELVGENKCFLPAQKAEEMRRKAGWTTEQLMLALLPLAKDASRAQVSGYPVGAVGLGQGGDVYFGGNLSFIGVPVAQSAHGEQSLVAVARARGEKKLAALAVSDIPCGHCRQFLNQLGAPKEVRILVPGKPVLTVAELLPHAYEGPSTQSSLFEVWENKLSLPEKTAASAGALKKALEAANASPSRYSPSGVALKMKDGTLYSGGYLEVSGGNPSLPPLQAALAVLVAEGKAYEDIAEAVLVEAAGARVVQEAATRELLSKIAPRAAFAAVKAERPK